ncbi:MAG: GNAT family N-acetyltransferase [Pseudomonadota bacterium]
MGAILAMIVEILEDLTEIPQTRWDALVGDGNPFVSHGFLQALQETNCVGEDTGWEPHYGILRNGQEICALAPLYKKYHSQGEYNFDHQWAHAFERALGMPYYPKMLVASPFSPITGPRLLCGEDNHTRVSFAHALRAHAKEKHVSGLHVNFAQDHDIAALRAAGFHVRMHHQYHWFNRNYESFDAFLQSLNARKRKNIRKERARLAQQGITHRWVTGGDIDPEDWDIFYRFYVDTYDRKWGTPYFTRACLDAFSKRITENLVLIIAEISSTPIAAALYFWGPDCLYGRNWGSLARFRFLHFETCYYQAMDFAICHGLGRVEAGTQGEHKLLRGYEPVPVYSAHYLPEQRFHDALGQYLQKEYHQSQETQELLTEYLPYKQV